ncbi:Acyltransferase [Rubripirellula amarantea]|uniref:Acyltransferase n=1 Tax=Rubripirellula amarantea TaxID=2527999 RepID=A0A5C5WSC0_9BACT|nr:1-acyl-sn-glycerol-3-phosphate acyltransferase [Rubripirellula amarantea]TWT53061.1 Acyltransferase [Rubripirellula amarantea]
MSVVLGRPYQFVPPHRGNLWPSFIQTFRIVDRYLHRKEGVVDFECRGLDRWRESVDRGDGILLAPNHCRYADPLVLGWPARELRQHVFAMASWHLFNEGWLDSFAIQKMGGFSINREGSDRQSLEMAIGILADAERPLILFPEGTTNRTNDVLKPMLEGITFIARTAARKRAKTSDGQVVMHPVALKYLCQGDITSWANEQLSELEDRLSWRISPSDTILQRTVRVAEGLLSLKEIEHVGNVGTGDLPQRRDQLMRALLEQAESKLNLIPGPDIRDRVRTIRSEVVARYFARPHTSDETEALRIYATKADLAQELLSYPTCYLDRELATDTRIVETIQRMQETFLGTANVAVPLKVVIQCDDAIVVPPHKSARGEEDPLLGLLRERLTSMITTLSAEARPATQCGLA